MSLFQYVKQQNQKRNKRINAGASSTSQLRRQISSPIPIPKQPVIPPRPKHYQQLHRHTEEQNEDVKIYGKIGENLLSIEDAQLQQGQSQQQNQTLQNNASQIRAKMEKCIMKRQIKEKEDSIFDEIIIKMI